MRSRWDAVVTFLDAERVDGSVARVDDAVLGAGRHDRLVDGQAGVFGDVQLPAQLAHKGQAHGSHLAGEGRGGGGREGREAGLDRVATDAGIKCDEEEQ